MKEIKVNDCQNCICSVCKNHESECCEWCEKVRYSTVKNCIGFEYDDPDIKPFGTNKGE